jgi:hypothetical protein
MQGKWSCRLIAVFCAGLVAGVVTVQGADLVLRTAHWCPFPRPGPLAGRWALWAPYCVGQFLV